VADVDPGPSVAHDVLVEPLAGAEVQVEAPVAEQGHRRSLLGDNRRVVADDRRCDSLGGFAAEAPWGGWRGGLHGVTRVANSIRSVTAAAAPSTDQAYGE
jgi:hypothetical protein